MTRYRFANFELQGRERRLFAAGQACAIGSRAFDVLLALVERQERVVSKNELIELAWPGLVVEENNLSVQISMLRKLLGPEAITTITGRGYQFSLPCEVHPVLPGATAPGGQQRLNRRLVALVCADVAPQPAAAPRASEPPAAAWYTTRSHHIEQSLGAFAGQAIEITAERTVLAFVSAVDAVAWCLDLQERLLHTAPLSGQPPLPLRLLVTVEEVVLDQGKLVGDPFAAAQALRQRVAPGEVCVSGAVRTLVAHRVAARYTPVGPAGSEPSAAPGMLWRLERKAAADAASSLPSPRLTWNQRPTLAVLPFEGGGAEGDAYFGEGITEEIITALSLNRSFFVIARGSTLKFRHSADAVAQAALELGVRYVISGLVRRQGQQLRIHVELTDASAQRLIWSDRYDGDDLDLFVFQARIAARVSAAIDPCVHQAELERQRLQPTESFGAYDCVLRGLALQFNPGAADFEAAGSFFRQAIELDADYARAHAYLARWYSLRAGDGRSTALGEDRARAEFHSQRAVHLDPRDAWNLAIAGHIQSFLRKRFAVAMDLFDQALSLNPNFALAWARSGTTLAYTGQGEEALERVRNALRLSPLDQHAFYFFTTSGLASFILGRFDEAVAWLSRAHRMNPAYRAPMRLMIAAHSLAGEQGEARELASRFLAEEPGFRISNFAAWYPLQAPHLGTLLQGLREAGLPE